ncbi:MAG: hypothetical protein IJ829_07670 [Kiritimatiellae bacterium]|nr:hypothetical protein [Kiritimatiellia bacterium]
MNKLTAGALLAALACGCVTNIKNDGGDADLKPAVLKDIAYEKYDISDQPVTASDQRVGILPFFCGNMLTVGGMSGHLADDIEHKRWEQESIALAKSGAYALACEKAGCDSLVGARYDVVYKWYYLWNEATVTVTGYPAKLTGVEFLKAPVNCPCCSAK